MSIRELPDQPSPPRRREMALASLLLLLVVMDAPAVAQSMPADTVPLLCDGTNPLLCTSVELGVLGGGGLGASATPPVPVCEPRCECHRSERRHTLEIDDDCDGVTDTRIVQRLDHRGNPRSVRTFVAGEEPPRACEYYRVNRLGQLVHQRSDYDCDGHEESSLDTTYADTGAPLSETADSDGDGEPDSWVRWRYDGSGNLTRVEYRYASPDDYPDTNCRYDPPCPPPFDNCYSAQLCWEAARPEPQRLAAVDVAALATSELTACPDHAMCSPAPSVCGCDRRGALRVLASDLDGDGYVDQVRTREVAPTTGGRTERIDVQADGTINVTDRYDAEEHLVETVHDDDGDGSEDWAMRFAYDAGGRLVEREDTVDGRLWRRTTYRWDDRGNLVSELRDDGADGTIDWRRTARYDELGRPTQLDWDCDGDGSAEATATFRYAGDAREPTEVTGNPDFSCSSLEVRYRAPPVETFIDFPNRTLRPGVGP